MDISRILKKTDYLLSERGVGYDKGQERSMARIVSAFNTITGNDLTETEGWEFMKVLKSVRMFTTDCPSDDTFMDAVAYATLQAECAMKGGH